MRDMYVWIKTINRPIMPPVRTAEESIPYKDGTIDYSEQNGRLYYEDKVLELEISLVDKDLRQLHRHISRVIAWLAGGYGDLIFDDMPLVVWRVRPMELDGVVPELQRVGKTVVQFRCKPFNKSIFSSKGIPLDSCLPLDSEIPLDYGSESELPLVSGGQTIEHPVRGNAPVAPVFVITGAMSSISIACNGCALTYNGVSFNEMILDCEEWSAKVDGVDVSALVSGDYPELLPNQINTITVTTDGSGTLSIVYFPQFFYGDDI